MECASMTSAEAHAAAAEEGLSLVRAENPSGFKGVAHTNKAGKPYQAQAMHGGRQEYLGTFVTAEEAALAVARSLRSASAAAAADAAPSRKRPAASDDAATHAAKRPAPPPRCYCDRPAVRLGDRFVCPLPDTRNYCTFGREDRMRIVPRFGIPAALAPKP